MRKRSSVYYIAPFFHACSDQIKSTCLYPKKKKELNVRRTCGCPKRKWARTATINPPPSFPLFLHQRRRGHLSSNYSKRLSCVRWGETFFIFFIWAGNRVAFSPPLPPSPASRSIGSVWEAMNPFLRQEKKREGQKVQIYLFRQNFFLQHICL